MRVEPLGVEHLNDLPDLMSSGEPFVRVRTASDYWAYARFFSSTCPVATEDGVLVGAAIAFRSQVDPTDIYVQDVIVHPRHRGRGLAGALLDDVGRFGRSRGCSRVYLTSEPENGAAHAAWLRHGFVNVPGDRRVRGVSVTSNFKGPGKDRAVYELVL